VASPPPQTTPKKIFKKIKIFQNIFKKYVEKTIFHVKNNE